MRQRNLDDNSQVAWEVLAGQRDDALNRLNSSDRDAHVLRFLKQQDLRPVGAALGIGEDAAQNRVSRAIERLRGILDQRGVAISATTLGSLLMAKTATAAPASLTLSVTAVSVAASQTTRHRHGSP